MRPPADAPIIAVTGTASCRPVQPRRSNTMMQRFMIEREIPGAAELTPSQLTEIARASNAVVASLDVPYTWITSYVAGDKVYCVHEAESVDTILEHARRGGFPANTVSMVANEFGSHTADG
jgi:hypothetical protein